MSRVWAALPALLCLAASKKVAFSNIWPRHNTSGAIMDAHDGSYNQWGGPGSPFYYYAMGYGTCIPGRHAKCGYGYSWIGVWKSTEGMANKSWSLVREARDDSWPKGSELDAYFRVHTVYNKKTRKYVMWVNLSNCTPGCYVVGTSSDPEGPFAYSNPTNGRFAGAGDFDILVDDDGAGYLIYTARHENHGMSVERLSDDYLYSTFDNNRPTQPAPETHTSLNAPSLPMPELSEGSGAPAPNSSGLFGAAFVEAPAIFKRKGVYYALFGKCCPFCANGSGAGVYTSTTTPLGPWTYHDNIGCLPTAEGVSATCGCGINKEDSKLHCPDLYGQSATQAQQNFVFPVTSSTGEVTWVWTGDMWHSARSGIKSEDRQFWTPLTFVKDPKSGLELPLGINSTLETFELDIA